MQINRLFEIVYLLLDKKQMTAKELAEHFEVSTRTIYRDVESLSTAGIPIYMSKGKGGGIALLPEFVLNKAVLTEKERVDVLSSLKALGAVSISESGTALRKLGNLFGNTEADWIEVDFGFWSDGEKESIIFETLKDAIFNKQITEFDYAATESTRKRRQVEPLKLVFKGSNWYLYAYCKEREDFRFFKLKRMQEIMVTKEKFNRSVPKRVLKDKSIYNNQPKIAVTLKLEKEAAYRAMDDFSEYEIQKDGSVVVRGEFIQGEWLIDMLFGYGMHCEIIEPLWLRDEVRQRLMKMIEKYGE